MTGHRFGLPQPGGDFDPIAKMKELVEGRTITEFVWEPSRVSFVFDDGWWMHFSVPFGPGIGVTFERPAEATD